jgi:hypothetical protein
MIALTGILQGWLDAQPMAPAETPIMASPVFPGVLQGASASYPGPGLTGFEPTPPSLWPTATLLPDRGVRLSPLQEVLAPSIGTSVGQVFAADLEGDTLMAAARVPGGMAVVAIDLTTGDVKQVSPVVQALDSISASDQYVAWLAPNLQQDTKTLQARQVNGSEVTVAGDIASDWSERHFFDLAGSIAVWREVREQRAAIIAFDLETAREVAYLEPAGIPSFPKPCGGEWMIYLERAPDSDAAELHGYNIATGTDNAIGRVPFPNNATAGRYHACAGNRAAWVSGSVEQGYAQHIYDLDKQSDRILDVQIPGLVVSQVLLSDSVLTGPAGGYDLVNDVAFSLPLQIPFASYTSSRLMLSGDRIAFVITEPNGVQHIYTATVVRD